MKVIIAILFIPPIMLWYSLTASVLWGWFMVPFFGLPVLSILQVWAVMMTLQAFLPRWKIHKPIGEFDWGGFFTSLIGRPVVALLFGAILKFWVLV